MLEKEVQYKLKNWMNKPEFNINWELDNDKQIVQKIIKYVGNNLSYEDHTKLSHRILIHSLYVKRYAIDIIEQDKNLYVPENVEKISTAALFHDVGKLLGVNNIIETYDDKNHAEYSAFMTKIILSKQNKWSDTEIDEIVNMINNHSLKGNNCPKDATPLAKILMDADLLDEKCGVRFFKLCMAKYSDEILLTRINTKIARKLNKTGRSKLKKNQIKEIIKKCKRDNLNNEDFDLLYNIFIADRDSNRKIVKEKSVCPELTIPLFESEIKYAYSLFCTTEVFGFTDKYFDDLIAKIK